MIGMGGRGAATLKTEAQGMQWMGRERGHTQCLCAHMCAVELQPCRHNMQLSRPSFECRSTNSTYVPPVAQQVDM